MKSWNRPGVPRLAGPASAPRLFDSSTDGLVDTASAASDSDGVATLYVCGITPYDATHLGHANTYLAYDTLVRAWLDAGYDVTYAQNTTDVDDPLLERATALGVDWAELAAAQTDLYRSDMQALSVIPPDHFVAVTSVIPEVAGATEALLESGYAYELAADDAPAGTADVYFDIAAASHVVPWVLGEESRLDRPEMLRLFAERGGDPDRVGKRDALDPLLWRGARTGEPSWSTVVGDGRPGWHIECAVIAVNHLGPSITVQGGGSDLLFPHHEFTSGHAAALTGAPFARIYSHSGMVAYDGSKMSKSLGNLVLVSTLLGEGTDPRVIRLALLGHHYRSDWEYTDDTRTDAAAKLDSWLAWSIRDLERLDESGRTDGADDAIVADLRAAIADDLDTPAAIAVIDAAILTGIPATAAAIDAVQALLGVDLRL